MPAIIEKPAAKATGSQSASEEIKALTGVRAIAALWVICFHFAGSFETLVPPFALFKPIFGFGWAGVDLFFVLSGFILSHVYTSTLRPLTWRAFGKFLWFRVARLYPNHLATLLILILGVMAARLKGITLTGDYPLSEIPAQLLMIHAWPYVSEYAGKTWNNVSWSICAEWFAYIFVFPLTHFLFRRPARVGPLVCFLYVSLAAWFFMPLWLKVWGLPCKVTCEFLAGCATWKLTQIHPSFVSLSARLISPLILLIVTASYFTKVFPYVPYLAILCFPSLLAALRSNDCFLSRVCGCRTILWLGHVSYALYMGHGVAQKCLKILLPAEKFANHSLSMRLSVFIVYWLVLFSTACVLYYLVEIPFRDKLRKLWR